MPEFGHPEKYDLWMGRWSARLTKPFVDFAHIPETGNILDVGCGTGTLTAALAENRPDRRVVGLEPSEQYVGFCRSRFGENNLSFEQGDAMALPFEAGTFDGVLSLLILQELPDAEKAVREMCRVTRSSGCVATCQWHFAGGLPMLGLFWEAAVEVLDDAATRSTASRVMEVNHPEESDLRRLWEEADLADIHTEVLEVPMSFTGFEDYWSPFLSGVTATASLAGSLAEDVRRVLQSTLRRRILGNDPDRPFTLPARAWAIRGAVRGD